MQQVDHIILKRTFFKYRILKFRAKLSYIAFSQSMTICELFANAILKTASDLLKFGLLTLDVGSKELVKDFDSLL